MNTFLILDAYFYLMIYKWQEKEYKEALEAFTDKNREKGQLIAKLVEVNCSRNYLVLWILGVGFYCHLFFDELLNSWWLKVRKWDWRSWRSLARTLMPCTEKFLFQEFTADFGDLWHYVVFFVVSRLFETHICFLTLECENYLKFALLLWIVH